MRGIYFSGQNKMFALYPFRNQIYRVSLEGGQATRPVLLCGDYLGELSDTYYKGTVYFCYTNRSHEIMIQNVTDRMPEYRLDRDAFYEEADYTAPRILNWQEHLLLFCLVKRPGGTGVTLEGIFPFEDRKLRLPDVFLEGATYTCRSFGEKIFLSVRESGAYRFFLSENMGDFEELLKEREAGEQCSDAEERFAQSALIWQDEKLRLETELREKERVIESVKVQYEDLMNTALQYREEAKKWREKFLTKK